MISGTSGAGGTGHVGGTGDGGGGAKLYNGGYGRSVSSTTVPEA